MSGLIFKGDVISSAGEYLPAPYINKITIDADAGDSISSTYAIEIYIFVDDFEYVKVSENGVIQDSKVAYKESLENLNYYVMVLSGVDQEIYDNLLTNKLNPLKFYDDFEAGEYDNSYVAMISVDALISEPTQIYDESGNRILVYSATVQSTELDSVFRTDQQISGKNIEYAISFCSTFQYEQGANELEDETYNAALLNLQTGDISYEKIYVSSDSNELSLQDTLKFYDSQNIIYDKTPLSSIEGSVYKINLTNHDEIKESINNLLSEYSDLYNTNSGYENLKSEMNSIYSTLELYGDEYDIVHRLDEVRKNFSDKTPIKPVGKLYKRFARRLFEINKSVTESEILNKKITYNSKLIDFRITTQDSDLQLSTESEDTNYIYSDPNLFSNISIEEDTKSIIAGYFLFDYEKAIRKNSVLSEYLDLDKLETLGLNMPYESYYIQNVSLKNNDAYIIGRFDENAKYPYTDSIRFVKDNDEFLEAGYLSENPNDINDSLYGYENPSNMQDAASLGFATSLINRSYAHYPSDEFTINNYRLMLFEVLEYRNDTNNNSYEVTVSLEDNTASYYQHIYETFKEYHDDFSEYYEKAVEACAYNHDLNKFNKYFIEALLNNYSQDSDATWYSAPTIYCLYADLLYNLFLGDMESIEKEAKTIASAVNPYTGDINSIGVFKAKMDSLLGAMKGIDMKIFDNSSPLQKEFESTIAIFEPIIDSMEVQTDGGFIGTDINTVDILLPGEQTDLLENNQILEDEIEMNSYDLGEGL